MEPAYEIMLDEKSQAMLGRLTIIMGQIDEIIIRTVQSLLKVDRMAADVIVGSSKVADNAAIWRETIRNRTQDEDVLNWLVPHAFSELRDISKDRNDFVHVWFEMGNDYVAPGYAARGYFAETEPYARRVRGKPEKYRPISDLKAVVERAATLSCLIAHIDHLMNGQQAATSPWLERLAPKLPPHPPKGGIRPQGRGRRAQRGSSQS